MQTYPETTKITGKEYFIERLSEYNVKDLARLHSEVYGTPVNEEYFQKKYDTAYTGIKYIGVLAYNKTNLPVAYYGVIPCFLEYENEKSLAAQSADTMTHPGYRYKGMFVELSNIAFDLCRQQGIRVVFGFPNQNSYHGAINKLGWKETENMNCFTIPVKAPPLQSISKKIKLHKLYQTMSNHFLKKYLIASNGVQASVIRDGFAGLHRSTEYLSWKTYSSTKLLGMCDSRVWISKKSGLLIGDIENVNEKNFIGTINELKKTAATLGLRYLQFHSSPGTSLHELFSSCSTVSTSFPVLFQDFGSPVPLEKIKFTFADIDIF